jgi:D-alanyl-D-alanine carboxypeptidase
VNKDLAEMNIFPVNWKLMIGILIGLIVIIAAVLRFTRSVSPFVPPDDRLINAWGTLDREKAQQLQAVLDDEVNLQKVPGFQAFVRTSDGKTWSGVSGTTDLARKNLMQREDILRIGSVTKTFTAVIVLKLVEEGRLNLDDFIAKWFPDFPNAEQISVRQLLSHTSGIPEIIPRVIMKSIIPSTYWQPEELVNMIAQDASNFTPRGKYEYSNTNFIMLGLVAEKISGESITQLLHEQIIDPLNLEHTYFIPYEQAPARLVPGFERDMASIPGMLDIGVDNTSWATAAFTSGALASTADDLGVFFDHLFTGDLLSPASMKEMTTFIDAPNLGIPEQTGYGLGLMQLEVSGQELVGHIGWFMGSTAIAMHAPDKNYTIVVTCNLSTPDLVAVVAGLQKVIR